MHPIMVAQLNKRNNHMNRLNSQALTSIRKMVLHMSHPAEQLVTASQAVLNFSKGNIDITGLERALNIELTADESVKVMGEVMGNLLPVNEPPASTQIKLRPLQTAILVNKVFCHATEPDAMLDLLNDWSNGHITTEQFQGTIRAAGEPNHEQIMKWLWLAVEL